MKKWKQLCLVFSLTLIISLCRTLIGEEEVYIPDIYERYTATENTPEHFISLGVKEMNYQRDGVEASYPQFVSGTEDDRLKHWNQIIEEDVNKIIDIYAFRPFPQTGLSPTEEPPSTLNIRYEIKTLGERVFSIFYRAAFFSKYSAYPTDLAYTTNLDLANDKRMMLTDIVRVDESFVKDFYQWDMIPTEQGNEELNKAILDYLHGLGDQALLSGFQTADLIGSGNYLGIYSYLTPDRLGISISVPNYLGDHVEFEKKYSELGDKLLIKLPV